MAYNWLLFAAFLLKLIRQNLTGRKITAHVIAAINPGVFVTLFENNIDRDISSLHAVRWFSLLCQKYCVWEIPAKIWEKWGEKVNICLLICDPKFNKL